MLKDVFRYDAQLKKMTFIIVAINILLYMWVIKARSELVQSDSGPSFSVRTIECIDKERRPWLVNGDVQVFYVRIKHKGHFFFVLRTIKLCQWYNYRQYCLIKSINNRQVHSF